MNGKGDGQPVALFVAASKFYLYSVVMKHKILIALMAVALPIASQAGTKKEPLRLKQTSQWNVDYADERCRLIRKFGDSKDQVFLIFDQFGPGEYFRMTIAGKPVKSSANESRVFYQFGPDEAEQDMGFYQGDLGEHPALIYKGKSRFAPPSQAEQALIANAKEGEWIELAPISPERMDAIRTLTIGKPLRRSVILETGAMRKPMQAMGACIDNLMTSWGIDIERHKKLTRPATPLTTPDSWVKSRDYPEKMLNARQSAIVEFRLSVDADGKPTGCFIQLTTRPAEFDKAVCGALMKRAQFAPALDEEAKPLPSYYRNSINFAIRQ